MKNYTLFTVTALALTAGLSACGSDSNQPGNQAGYASDGTNDCSMALVSDYNDIAMDYDNVKAEMDGFAGASVALIGTQEIQIIQSEMNQTSSEISAFNSNYGGVSCTALDTSNGSTTTIDQAAINDISTKLAAYQNELTLASAPAPFPIPAPVQPAPVSNTQDCVNAGMVKDNLPISSGLSDMDKTLQTEEKEPNSQQKLEELNRAEAQLDQLDKQLATYNQEYAGAYCTLPSMTMTASALSESDSTQSDQLHARIKKDLSEHP
jgi:hypothetical protein